MPECAVCTRVDQFKYKKSPTHGVLFCLLLKKKRCTRKCYLNWSTLVCTSTSQKSTRDGMKRNKKTDNAASIARYFNLIFHKFIFHSILFTCADYRTLFLYHIWLSIFRWQYEMRKNHISKHKERKKKLFATHSACACFCAYVWKCFIVGHIFFAMQTC